VPALKELVDIGGIGREVLAEIARVAECEPETVVVGDVELNGLLQGGGEDVEEPGAELVPL